MRLPFSLNVSLNRSSVCKVERKRKRSLAYNFCVYVRSFIHPLYFVNMRSQVKTRRQWKSILTKLFAGSCYMLTIPNNLTGEGTNPE